MGINVWYAHSQLMVLAAAQEVAASDSLRNKSLQEWVTNAQR